MKYFLNGRPKLPTQPLWYIQLSALTFTHVSEKAGLWTKFDKTKFMTNSIMNENITIDDNIVRKIHTNKYRARKIEIRTDNQAHETRIGLISTAFDKQPLSKNFNLNVSETKG